MRELFEKVVMYVCFAGLGGIAVAAFVRATWPTAVAKARSAAENARKNGMVATFVVVFAVCGIIVYGSTKNSTQSRRGAEGESPSQLLCASAPLRDETEAPSVRALTAGDYAAGFALSRVGTNETHNFSAPAGAHVCADWAAFGAERDWFKANFTNEWTFVLGTNTIDALTVFSYGKTRPHMKDRSTFISPFETSLGIVPASNWEQLGCGPSQFWHCLTPSNTLVMTWRNALLNRDANCPVSFQMECWPEGRIMFRYDLSQVPTEVVSNLLVGIRNEGSGRVFSQLLRGTTSLTWERVTVDDLEHEDRDGDGISTEDEIMVWHTDPDLRDTDGDGLSDGEEIELGTNPLVRDTDGDGLVDGSDPDPLNPTSASDLDGDGIYDAYEVYWFGGTNAVDETSSRDATGFTLATKMLGGVNPTNAAAAAHVVSTNALVSWKLFDGFALDLPVGATNLVWERTFSVNRTSAWQQFFVSSSPTDASAWCLNGAALEWETDTGRSGSARFSPCRDSFRIPLAADDLPSALTLRIRADAGGAIRSPTPLHLIAYAPEFRLEGGLTITGDGGGTFHVFTEGSDSRIRLVIDDARRPHHAASTAEEQNMSMLDDFAMQSGGCSFEGGATGGTIAAPRPGVYSMPDFSLGVAGLPSRNGVRRIRSSRSGGGSLIVLDPSAGWACKGHGCTYDGLGYDWSQDWYYEESSYPLDTKCLRKKWYRDWGGGWYTGDCELTVSSGVGDDDAGPITTSVEGTTGKVLVDGVVVWSGTAEHVYDGGGCGGEYREDVLGGGCDSCDTDCADGNCDSLEGPTLGSLKFRIPLGAPVKGQVAGFVWFETEGPVFISRNAFQLLEHPNANVSDTTSGGVRRIVCSDARGRDLRIEDIANGVRITIYETLGQKLEHTWEVVNVDGSASCVRLRKISRQNNTMSDETYTYTDGDWTQFDNIAGVGTQLTVYNDFSDYGDGGRYETRTMTDAEGNVLSSVTTEQRRIGECDNAVLRETYRSESTGWNWKWSEADYWNDPVHSARHGMPRLVRGNARAWVYTDFDEFGHEILRVEQRGNASVPNTFPLVVSNALVNAEVLADAFVTLREFSPLVGDSAHADDAAKARIETRYVVENGVANLIGRTWHRYSRLTRNGYAAIKHETWRAVAQGAEFDSSGNAYSYEIAYDDTGVGTPLLMRDAIVESLDENGVKTVYAYSPSDDALVCVARRYGPDGVSQFPTYEATEQDKSYGTVLRRTTRLTVNNTTIADEQSVYDEKNRLRSTTYLDGTSLTNAYSCCRLLWSEDREGRRTLRSALTGSDHLYNADEEVWLADVSTNGGFKVTQHYYDALGRETNTIVGISYTPGASTSPTSTLHSALCTLNSSYPYGGSDYAITTDERGRVTLRRSDIIEGGIETGEAVFTNGVEIVKTKRRSYFGGGSSTRREWDGDRFTEERRFDNYLADGRRVGYVVTESSDYGVVTNSVTTYDLLGRVVTSVVPGANGSVVTTAYAYDGSLGRKLSSSTTGSPVVTYAYDTRGELVRTTQDGRSSGSVTTYETVGGEVCRVVTNTRLTGSVTNSVQRQIRQLTGLSYGLLARTVSVSASARETVSTRSHDVETGLTTDIVANDGNTPLTTISRLGLPIEESSRDGRNETFYDAFGRVASVIAIDLASGATNRIDRMEYDASENVVRTASDFQDGRVAVSTAEYDMLNRNIASTDALGHVRTTDYDSLNRSIFTGGDAYPIQTGYDTAGRKTASRTTRDNGATWDETSWEYDVATGLNTAKEYADGSRIAYAYTDNGRRTRTTWARGVWKENAYNDRSLVSGTTYSDATPSVSYSYADSGKVESATIAGDTSYAYAYDERLLNTNEVVMVGGDAFTVARTYDDHWRACETSVLVTNVPHAAKTRLYDSEDRVCGYALTNSAGRGLSVSLSYDGSCLTNMFYTLPGGSRFSAQLTREPARKELVTNRAYSFNGSPTYSYSTDYDLLGRPTNAVDSLSSAREWHYNRRSELAQATVGTNLFGYAYDTIGNRNWDSSNAVTNNYTANNLNQYTCLNRTIEQSEQSNNLSYDADGNLTNDGRFVYAYDAENRLVSVTSAVETNGAIRVLNAYDHRNRRVRKTVQRLLDTNPPPPSAPTGTRAWQTLETRTFVWDGMNIILEVIVYADGTESVVEYFWGTDKSGTEQGAGGVGGLLAVSMGGQFYIPCYDHNGNIVCYVAENGSIAGQYLYDPYGNVPEQYGTMPMAFNFGFSTKYQDREVGMVGYQRRFYRPDLGRWLNRDPIEEDGGENLYAFCINNPILFVDALGNISIMNIVNGIIQVASGAFMMKAGIGVTVGSAGLATAGGVLLTTWGAMSIVNGVNTIMSEFGLSDNQDPIQVQISQVVTESLTGEPLSPQGKHHIVMAYTAADIVMSCASIRISWQAMVKEKAIYTYAVRSSEDVMVQLDKTRPASLLKLTEVKSTIHLTGTLNGTSMSNGISIIMDYKALWSDVYEESDAIFNPEH